MNNISQKFLVQGSILAIAGLLVRLIGMLYRIPMISIIGSEGIGYYTSAFSLYSLFLILSSYSFPTAISKLISFRLANNRYADCKTLFFCSFFMAFVVGSIMFLIMYFGADIIAMLYQKPLLSHSLRALAPTLFIMAFLSVFRGIFQGTGNMIPTAISQIFEQIVNAVFSIILSFIYFNKGKIANLIYEDTEYAYAFGAKGGAIGTGLGAFVALCILIFLFLNLISNYKYLFKNNNYFQLESKKEIYHNLAITIIPIILSTTIYNVTSVIDDLIFSNVETYLGNYSTIVSMWGLYGQFHLLFNIPVAISNSLTSSVIPSLSQSVAIKDAKSVVKKTKYSIKYTLLIVLPAFCGMTVLAEPICKLLFFNTNDMDILIYMVEVGSISIIFFSLSTITNGILQGLGLFNIPVKNGIIALIIHIIALFIMLIPFKLGINAIIYSNIVFAIAIYVLNQFYINKYIKYNKQLIRNYILPVVSSISMGFLVKYIYDFLNDNIFSDEIMIFIIIKLVLCIFIGIISYLFLIVVLGIVRKRDIEYMPILSKIYLFLRN